MKVQTRKGKSICILLLSFFVSMYAFFTVTGSINNKSIYDNLAVTVKLNISSTSKPTNQMMIAMKKAPSLSPTTAPLSLQEPLMNTSSYSEEDIEIEMKKTISNINDDFIEFYKKSNGVLVHQTDAYHYEVDELNENPMISEEEELVFGRKWKSFILKEENLHDYLLPTEIESSRRRGVNGNKQTTKNDICTSICCAGSYPIHLNYSLFEMTARTNQDYMLRTWFKPAGGRKSRSIVDALDLMIDIGEKKGRNLTHFIMLGDSLGQQMYLHMMCSIQRTLGAKIVKRGLSSIGFPLLYKIPLQASIPYIIDEFIVEINSTRSRNQHRKIKITFLKYFREFININPNRDIPVYASLACGLNMTLRYLGPDNNKTTLNITSVNEPPVALMITTGTHYASSKEFNRIFLNSLGIYKQCKANGVEVIIKERSPQHFRDNYGGYHTGTPNIYSKSFVDLRGRSISIPNSSYCGPLVLDNHTQLNPFHHPYVKLKQVQQNVKIIDGNEIDACNKRKDRMKIDFLSTFAALSPYWSSHRLHDCTHYLYSPGIFLPFADWIFTIVYKWTLPIETCKQIPSAIFLHGPEGYKVGIRDGYPKEMLPTIDMNVLIQNVKLNETFLKPLLNL